MKIGDVMINPSVQKEFNGKPNPIYKSMVIHKDAKYTTVLRIDGKTSQYYTKDCRDWEISHHIDLGALLTNAEHDKQIRAEVIERIDNLRQQYVDACNMCTSTKCKDCKINQFIEDLEQLKGAENDRHKS